MTAFPGTDRIKRPMTVEESKAFGKLLPAHDYPGAYLVALRFARSLTRSNAAAEDLVSRANVRLVRWGWDPNEVALKKRMCRLVWSEWTHEKAETAKARHAEEVFFARQKAERGEATPSPEEIAQANAQQRKEEADQAAYFDALRARFEKKKDEVNLLWLKYQLEEIEDPREMARLSGRDVGDFYMAAKRRKRITERLMGLGEGEKDDNE
jgi:hypothetical protein